MGIRVTIQGDGVAACACARLLTAKEIPLSWEPAGRATQPAIMLGLPTLRMLGDIFGAQAFETFQPVRKRVVLWGKSEVSEVPHAAIVVSEATLLAHLRTFSPPPDDRFETAWTIRANRAASQNVKEHSFGKRQATAYAVRLKPESSEETCWIESLEKGWLFLLPEGAGKARLLSIGDLDGNGLAQSRLIGEQVESIDGPGTTFPSQPRIADPLCGPQWISCGTAAVSFDPLCGEGAGHALREAILANAVIQAALGGADPDDLLHHYRNRIIAGFARHLQTCVEFYASGHQGPWWDEQLAGLNEGLAWCRAQLEQSSQPKFRLQNFALESL